MVAQLELKMSNESGKKRGRPVTTGETGIFRVARDLYLMISWIADAKRLTQSQVADRYLRGVITKVYLSLLPEIKQRKRAEDERAKQEGGEPLPMPRIEIHVPPKLRPRDMVDTGDDTVWADRVSEEFLKELLEYVGKDDNDPSEGSDYVAFFTDPALNEPPPEPESPAPKKKPKPKK